jgi:hypothetical protein
MLDLLRGGTPAIGDCPSACRSRMQIADRGELSVTQTGGRLEALDEVTVTVLDEPGKNTAS